MGFKTKWYNFFQDELNRQLPKEKTKSVNKKNKKTMKKIEEMETIMEIADEILLPITDKPIEEPIVEVEEEPQMVFPSISSEPLNLVEKYTVKINDIDKELAELSVKMLELNNRKKIYEEVLNDLADRGE